VAAKAEKMILFMSMLLFGALPNACRHPGRFAVRSA